MTGLKILVGVLLVLFLLGRIRLGGEAEYSEEGFLVRARAGWLRFQVFPLIKKEKKKKKQPKPKKEKSASKGEKPEESSKQKKGGSLALVKQFLPLVGEAAGELRQRIRIDRLYLNLTVATSNAAGTAMAYGYANMALGMIWPIIEQNFEVKDPRIGTGVDFTAQSPAIYIDAAFSARLGQLLSFGLRFGWKALRIYLRNRPRVNENQKEAI